AVQNGQYDATLQDLPAARFYADRFPGLELVGPPESHGYYVIYVRSRAPELRDALDAGLARLIASGELRKIYNTYGIWTEARGGLGRGGGGGPAGVWPLLPRSGPRRPGGGWVPGVRSVPPRPRAGALGRLPASGRLSGPPPVRAVLSGYVELLRGTPLMLQLF